MGRLKYWSGFSGEAILQGVNLQAEALLRYPYILLAYLLLPMVFLRLLIRSLKTPAYRQRLGQRLGFAPVRENLSRPAIWIHAVSVGEVVAAQPLVAALLEENAEHQIILTTTTPTGFALARDLFPEEVLYSYFPWDTPDAWARFFKRTRPSLLLLVETELWPNLLAMSRRNGCEVVLVSARLSERSRNRYQIVKPLAREMLNNMAHIACQSAADAERFEQLGMRPDAITVTGSLKGEVAISAKMREQSDLLRSFLNAENRPVIVAGSTHEREEEIILDAFAKALESNGNCLLLLAPRHPERCDEVFDLCKSRGLDSIRRSSGEAPAQHHAVLLIDVLGELPLFYGTAEIAILGGSFIPRGGHNVLEASVWGVPCISGPSTYNFSTAYSSLLREEGVLVVSGAGELGIALQELLSDPARREAIGMAGCKVVEQSRGTCAATLNVIAGLGV
jgi:3-deoxy-D-manno-octulosonic-acid transferase